MADTTAILCLFHGETFDEHFAVRIDRSQYCRDLRDAIKANNPNSPATMDPSQLQLWKVMGTWYGHVGHEGWWSRETLYHWPEPVTLPVCVGQDMTTPRVLPPIHQHWPRDPRYHRWLKLSICSCHTCLLHRLHSLKEGKEVRNKEGDEQTKGVT